MFMIYCDAAETQIIDHKIMIEGLSDSPRLPVRTLPLGVGSQLSLSGAGLCTA